MVCVPERSEWRSVHADRALLCSCGLEMLPARRRLRNSENGDGAVMFELRLPPYTPPFAHAVVHREECPYTWPPRADSPAFAAIVHASFALQVTASVSPSAIWPRKTFSSTSPDSALRGSLLAF